MHAAASVALVALVAGLAGAGCARVGECALRLDGVEEAGAFAVCDAKIIDDATPGFLLGAEQLDACPDDSLCGLVVNAPGAAAGTTTTCDDDGTNVLLLLPSFDDEATAEELQDGVANGSAGACTITTDTLDGLGLYRSWSGRIEAQVQIPDGSLVDVVIEGDVPMPPGR